MDNVTIVIPVFNRVTRVRLALELIPEHYPLILVDNGSTDGTAEFLAEYCRRRKNAVFAQEPERGACAARNRGLSLCQTEWVYFFDSDDEFTSLPNPKKTKKYDMFCFPVMMVVAGDERVRDYRPVKDPATHVLNAMLGTHSMLFRTSWLRSIGGWDNRCRIWNDWELGLRALLCRPRMRWITDKARHRVFVHPNSITGPNYSARSEAIRDTLLVAYDDARTAANDRVLRALDLRTRIVCGVLRREGSSTAASSIRPLAKSTFIGWLLETYCALGGRGAWRIALAILNYGEKR